MKKLSILFACLVAVLGFSSCEDTDPQYQNPTKFVLNTPALANQLYELSADGTIDLSWSQPDYGYAATAAYYVQVSLDGTDSTFVECGTKYVRCYAQVKASEVAEAICKLRGIESEDDYTDEPARKVYFRVRALIDGIEGSEILSNVIALNQVKEYCAIQSPGYIYLIGNVGGWTGPDGANADALAKWRLFESATAIGSKIYSGVFDMPPSSTMLDDKGNVQGLLFRFYTELTGWDGGASVGMQVDDNPVAIQLVDGMYNGTLVAPGKGSVQILDWAGGSMKITVNLSGKVPSMIIEAGGVDTNGKKFIYIVGAVSGWTEPSEANSAHYEDYKLYDLEDNGVYSATFDLAADQGMFRFYNTLCGWAGNDSFGVKENDGDNVDVELTDGVYTGNYVAGKGNWNIAGWEGGKLAISVDVNTQKVTFTKK